MVVRRGDVTEGKDLLKVEDVSHWDERGDAALHLAAKLRNDELVRSLLEAG
jgi:ankyrin repeat protein